MANADRPSGFKPWGPILRVRPYLAKGTISAGDAVNRKAGSSDTDGRCEVEEADASEALVGVAAHAATSGQEVLVYDHPDQEFVVQADESDIATNAKIGLNYDLVATNGVSGNSRHELDSSTYATTATLPLRLLRIAPLADNAIGEFCKCIVKINNHQLGNHTGTAGV